MKLQVKCDGCGKEGHSDFFFTDYDNCDWCQSCNLKNSIMALEVNIKDKKKWLAETHLKKIDEWEKELKGLQEMLDNQEKP